MHQRVDARQDLGEGVGPVELAHRDLGAHRPERLRGTRTADGRTHLVPREQRPDDGGADHAGGPRHHHGHGARLSVSATEQHLQPVALHLQHTATIDRAMAAAPVIDFGDVMDLLRSRGLRMTPQRRAIVSEVMRTNGHISPAAIARKVQGEMPGVNASTVYRTLTLLEEVGVLQHSHLESGAEYHRAEEAQHVHLTCCRCGRDDALSHRRGRARSAPDPPAPRVRGRPDALRDHRPVRRLRGGRWPAQPPNSAGSTLPFPKRNSRPITRLNVAGEHRDRRRRSSSSARRAGTRRPTRA